MAERTVGLIGEQEWGDSPEDHYEKLIDAFHNYDRHELPAAATRRVSAGGPAIEAQRGARTAGRCHSAPAVSPYSLDLAAKSPVSINKMRGRSDHSDRSTTVTSSCTSDADYSPRFGMDSLSTEFMDADLRNEFLVEENRRLKQILYEMELHNADGTGDELPGSQNTHKDDKNADEVSKLNRKVKVLKSKYKDEKLKLLQMEKSIDTHHSEIEGLQRELSRSVDTIERLENDRTADKALISKLNRQLKDCQQCHRPINGQNLETELHQRTDELEMTLERLQQKVERIIQLEDAVEQANKKLEASEKRCRDLQIRHGNNELQRDVVAKFREYQAECKKLKRQNMMLKLLVEELEETRRQGHDCDLDSVFDKLPPDLRFIQDPGDDELATSEHTFDTTGAISDHFRKEMERFNLEGSSSNLRFEEKASKRESGLKTGHDF